MEEAKPNFIPLSDIPINGQFLISIFGPTFERINVYGDGRSLVKELPGGDPKPMENTTPVIKISDPALGNTRGFSSKPEKKGQNSKGPKLRGLFD